MILNTHAMNKISDEGCDLLPHEKNYNYTIFSMLQTPFCMHCLEWQFSGNVDDYAHKCICANGQYVCCFLSNKYMVLPGRTLQWESVYRKYLLLKSITNADYTQVFIAYKCPAELNICWGWLIAYIVLIDKHVNSPHKGPVTRKIFPFDDVIMNFEYETANSCLTLQMPLCLQNSKHPMLPGHKLVQSCLLYFLYSSRD